MKILKWIHEGEQIPNGFWIKTGLFYIREQWKPQTIKTFGRDGLVESLVYTEVPTGDPTGMWFTIGFQVGHFFRVSWRFKDWSKSVIFNYAFNC